MDPLARVKYSKERRPSMHTNDPSKPSSSAPASPAQVPPSSASGHRPSKKYAAQKIAGKGAFGTVYIAIAEDTGEKVAIKKVLQDERFKNRELEIMQELHHPNVVHMEHSFYSQNSKKDEVFLNLVLEFVPDTLEGVIRSYHKAKSRVPMILVKLFMYQLCRSLNYVHSLGICHRDIKPQNILVDSRNSVLKLCDFGSAKRLIPGEPNVAYICSRFYRAPELIFGVQDYTTAIDIWSAGCVMAEIMMGTPLFCGESNLDQLLKIVSVLGTPTPTQLQVLNPKVPENKFPVVKGKSWDKVLPPYATEEACDLMNRLMQYAPQDRITAIEALAHPFFDDLRDPKTVLPNGAPLPELFDFSEQELSLCRDDLREFLLTRRPQPGAAGVSGSASVSTSEGSTSSSSPDRELCDRLTSALSLQRQGRSDSL